MAKKKQLTETKWVNIVENVEDYEAFVYMIVNRETGRKYIGRKFTKQRRRRKPNKDAKRRKLTISESDWRTYKSSSSELIKDIEKYGEDAFDFIILDWTDNRIKAMYLELEYQVKNDVLTKRLPNGEFEFYNTNIMTKYFRPKESEPHTKIVDRNIEKYIQQEGE